LWREGWTRKNKYERKNKKKINTIMLEGPHRPLNPAKKMLIVTTPGSENAATPLERRKNNRAVAKGE
jgi:hypothetical protein